MSYLSRINYNISHPHNVRDNKFSTKNVEKNPDLALRFIVNVEKNSARARAPKDFSTSPQSGFFHVFVDKWTNEK